MDFKALSENRHSVRSYLPDAIETEKLNIILETMRLAPSAGNGQSWKFFAVTDKKLIDAIAEVTLSKFVSEAPCVLVACGKGDSIMRSGHDVTTVDVSIAMTIGMMAATDLGLGSCLIASHEQEPVCKILGLDDEWRIPMICTLGYQNGEVQVREKKPFEEVCFIK